MMNETVYLNGSFMPPEDAHIPVLDRGFIFGDGVYEVIPVYSRRPFRLTEHLKRLQFSLDAAVIHITLSETVSDEDDALAFGRGRHGLCA